MNDLKLQPTIATRALATQVGARIGAFAALFVVGCAAEIDTDAPSSHVDDEPVAVAQGPLLDGYRLQGIHAESRSRSDLDGNGLDEVWAHNYDAEGYVYQRLALEALPSGSMRVVRELTPGRQYGLWTYQRGQVLQPTGNADGFGGKELIVTSTTVSSWGEFGLLHNQPESLSGFARAARPPSDDMPLGGEFFENDRTTYLTLNTYAGAMWVVKQDRGGFSTVATLDPTITGTDGRMRPLAAGRFWGPNASQGWYAGDGYNVYLLKATAGGAIEIRAKAAWSSLNPFAGGTVLGVRDFLGSGEDSVFASADFQGLSIMARSGNTVVVAARAPRSEPVGGYLLADRWRNHEAQPPLAADLDGDGRAAVVARSTQGDILVLQANPATQRFDLLAAHPHWKPIGGWILAANHVLVATGRFERSDRDALAIRSTWGIGMIGWTKERGFYAFAAVPFDR